MKNAQCRVYIRGSRGLQYLCSVPRVVSALRCAWERTAAPVRGGLPSAMQVVEPFAYMVRDGARSGRITVGLGFGLGRRVGAGVRPSSFSPGSAK